MELLNTIISIPKDELQILMKNSSEALKIIRLFIKENFTEHPTYEEVVEELNSLINLCKKGNFFPSPDFIEKLLKENTTLINAIEIIFIQNKETILSGNIDEVFKEDLLVIFLETYCLFKGIEITEEVIDIKEGKEEKELDIIKLYLRDIYSKKILSRKEEIELAKRKDNKDQEAYKILLESNLKFVVKLAKKYKYRGLPFLDVVQEGNLGLMKAIKKFDWKRGFRLTTYATPWIRQRIAKALAATSRTFYVPSEVHEEARSYQKEKNKLQQTFGEISPKEMASKMQISEEKVNLYENLINPITSLNTKINGEDTEFEEKFFKEEKGPEDIILQHSFISQCLKILNTLDIKDRDKEIFLNRYPIDGRPFKTFEEVGKIFDIKRQRVQQIELEVFINFIFSKEIDTLIDWTENQEEAKTYLKRMRQFYQDKKNWTKTFKG